MNCIHFFGCSFSALENSETGYTFINFRKLIEQRLSIKCINHSYQGRSNEQIIDDVYNISKTINDTENTIFVIQTTFLNRLGLYFDLNDRFESICKMENPDNEKEKIFIEFYNLWLKYFYNPNAQLSEYQKNFNLLSAWLRQLGIKFIMIGLDESLDLIKDIEFFKKNNFLEFEKHKSFYSYAVLNQLRIFDTIAKEMNNISDYHFNQKGHDILAEQIVKKINDLTQ